MSPIPRVSITAAFRSSKPNAAYIFMNNEYVLLDYGHGLTRDKILNGGRVIRVSDGFPSLKDTRFGDHGIECAFDTVGNEAYIFSGNLCAHIAYALGTTGDEKILKGPMSIIAMFHSLQGTVFENGIDAAFNAGSGMVYIFKGDQYAVLNYPFNSVLQTKSRAIKNGWKSLTGTIFESGIEAAFATHEPKRAYVFKGDQYASINFGDHSFRNIDDKPKRRVQQQKWISDDYMVGGKTALISRYWPGIGGILASKNGK